MRKTAAIVFFAIILLLVVGWLTSCGNKEKKDPVDQQYEQLKEQEKLLQKISAQQDSIIKSNRERDSVESVRYNNLVEKNRTELSQAKKQSNDKKTRIDAPDFDSDSIRRAFAEN